MGGGGGWGGVGGGEDSFSLVFENSIVLIKCTLYDTVFQRQVSICRGVVFSYSFSIYCAAYHGIWCSVNFIFVKSRPPPPTHTPCTVYSEALTI